MNNNPKNNGKIPEHIFNGSTTMVGVSITVIALFKVMKISIDTYADEILSADTCLFLAAAILAYTALRKEENAKLERIANILFFTGMAIMMIVAFIIVYSTY